jgi:hypothetical protein
VDIIAQAQAKFEFHSSQAGYHSAEAKKWQAFMAQAKELEDNEFAPAEMQIVQSRLATQPRERTAPKSGTIYETAMAARSFMEAHGEGQRTKDLLAPVREAGVEVGGKNVVATLSARLSGSQMFRLEGGKWFIRREGA